MMEPQSPTTFNPADYPRHYVYETPIYAWALGLLIVVTVSFLSAYTLAYNSLRHALPEDYIALSIGGLMMAILIAFLMIHRIEVDMSADEIKVKKLFRQGTLKRRDIKGWHYCHKWNAEGKFIALVPLRPTDKTLYMKEDDFENLCADDAFHTWYQSLPDLQREEKDSYFAAIKNAGALGKTDEERLRNKEYALRIFHWMSYLTFILYFFLFALPNAYFPSLTDAVGLTLTFLTIISVLIIYRCPVLLTDPPLGTGRHRNDAHSFIGIWGFILFVWFYRDSALQRMMPDLLAVSFNFYMLGIFLFLLTPLLADRNWRQIPRRLITGAFGFIFSTMGFYFYGNVALDRATPIIEATSYELHSFGNPESKTLYMLEDRGIDSRGKMIEGCSYKYPGAFGTPWERTGPCPENFLKQEAVK